LKSVVVAVKKNMSLIQGYKYQDKLKPLVHRLHLTYLSQTQVIKLWLMN